MASQSPRIGAIIRMVFLALLVSTIAMGLNPLESGQSFESGNNAGQVNAVLLSLNPLESGQSFE